MRERRRLEELNLLDNFLFGTVVTHPDYGESFSRYLLRVILNRDVGKLRVVPQSVFFGSDVNLHGATLDVYLEEQTEETKRQTIYDVEPEKNNHVDDVISLPRRMRFYRAKLDGRGLKAGEDYEKLKDLIMIMITPFDPFGKGCMTYTIKNACKEFPDMPFDDGATMLFLYTKGNPREASNELCQLLKYMENSTAENAVTKELRWLHGIVEQVKHDEEVAIRFMKLWEDERWIRKEAKAEGKAEDILELLEELGEVPESIRAELYSITDISRLSQMLKMAAKAENIEDFCEKCGFSAQR